MPRPDEPDDELKTNLNGSKPKGPVEQNQWQRSSDLTPEAWQQQVDQQLQQQETEQQAESWGNRNPPNHNSQPKYSVFKDSKSMFTKAPGFSQAIFVLRVIMIHSPSQVNNTFFVSLYSHDNKKCEAHHHSRGYLESLRSLCVSG